MTEAATNRAHSDYEDVGGTILISEAEGEELNALRDSLAAAGVQAKVRALPGPVRDASASGLGPDVTVLSVFVGSRVGSDVLAACPNLKLIATRSTGYDHIDLDACTRQGVTVANVPTYGENTVAEHTFALILALSRNVHKAWLRTQRGDFSLAGLQGFDLLGRTLGVIGTGHIGLHVAKIGRGFGMRVLAYDVHPRTLNADIVGFEYVEQDELVAQSDILTLHVPYLPATHHLVDRELLSKVKRGALLINTARGGLVDTGALLWALDEGILSGAGLDVLEGEEILTEDRRLLAVQADQNKLRSLLKTELLAGRENVVITPHIAFNSTEAVQRITDVTAGNVAGFLAGKPANVVNQT
jgi:D-lactate dehydrogenase